MTGGKAVILGMTGKNFAAGMSGGIAYVLDEDNKLYRNLNKELVLMEQIDSKGDKQELLEILKKHVKYTGSKKAGNIIEHYDEYLPKFKKIIPADYKKLLHLISGFEEQGMSREKAQIEAFYASTKNVTD
jgi:glutamate synthase (ferredoxin)